MGEKKLEKMMKTRNHKKLSSVQDLDGYRLPENIWTYAFSIPLRSAVKDLALNASRCIYIDSYIQTYN